MTPADKFLAILAIALVSAVIVALVDRWQRRRKLLGRLDWNRGGEREIDIVKRDVAPWPRAD